MYTISTILLQRMIFVVSNRELITMKQLEKELGKTRPTIHKYMNQGMPYVKKGRNNFFILNDVLKWVKRHKTSEEYAKVMNEVQSLFPNDPLKQLNYLKSNTSKRSYAMGMAEIAAEAFLFSPKIRDTQMSIDVSCFDDMFRALHFALHHINDDDDAFLYISSKLESFIFQAIKQRYSGKYIKKVHKTFFGEMIKTQEEINDIELDFEIKDHNIFFNSKEGL